MTDKLRNTINDILDGRSSNFDIREIKVLKNILT